MIPWDELFSQRTFEKGSKKGLKKGVEKRSVKKRGRSRKGKEKKRGQWYYSILLISFACAVHAGVNNATKDPRSVPGSDFLRDESRRPEKAMNLSSYRQ